MVLASFFICSPLLDAGVSSAFENICELNSKPIRCRVEPNRGHAFTMQLVDSGLTYNFVAPGSTWGSHLKVLKATDGSYQPVGDWEVMHNINKISVRDESSNDIYTIYK